jgi:hypothetical protein
MFDDYVNEYFIDYVQMAWESCTLFLLHIDGITSDGKIGKIAFPTRRQTGHLNSSLVTSYVWWRLFVDVCSSWKTVNQSYKRNVVLRGFDKDGKSW